MQIMPELRKDPVIGRWVIIASERARRPGNFVDRADGEVEKEDRGCLLCNNQREAIYTAKHVSFDGASSSSGDVRVISSDDDASPPREEFSRTKKGLYDVIDGVGKHEIVIETPEHIANMADLDREQIRLVFEAYVQRIRDLEDNTQFQYVLAYKNYGLSDRDHVMGHARSYIVATPVRPLRVKEKLLGAKEYFDVNKSCVYCDLIDQEIKARERIVYETEHFIAVIPFAARFLFETWILPKSHHSDFHRGVKGSEADLAQMMKVILRKLQQGLDNPAYSFVIQTAPFRQASLYTKKWETIEQDYHWHIELMPRLTRFAGFEKGTGFYICAIPPESMAEYLRGVEIK